MFLEMLMEARGKCGVLAEGIQVCVCMLINILARHTLIPPRGYSIAGVAGSYGQWVDGFSLIITR